MKRLHLCDATSADRRHSSRNRRPTHLDERRPRGRCRTARSARVPNTMIVEPCSNHPARRPSRNAASHGRRFGPRYVSFSGAGRQCRRMLATRIAATGTSMQAGRPAELEIDDRALVLAEQPLDALQRDRIHVPRVARDVDAPRARARRRARESGDTCSTSGAASRTRHRGISRRGGRRRAAPRACRGSLWPGTPRSRESRPCAPTTASHGLTIDARIGDRSGVRRASSWRVKHSCMLLKSAALRFVQAQVAAERLPHRERQTRARAVARCG